jgi:aldehyde dehydrogenase (NAD+)
MTTEQLQAMRNFFSSGTTKTYAFRIEQLKKLKQAILKYEQEISAALYADLKKSPEESYSTEIGLVLAEISLAIKKLCTWMEPQSVPTDLANLPSGSKIYRDRWALF